jgi:hypothetical protein
MSTPLSEEELAAASNLSRDLFLIHDDDDHNRLRAYIVRMELEVRRLHASQDAAVREEREACAKVCSNLARKYRTMSRTQFPDSEQMRVFYDHLADGCLEGGAAIRARDAT